MATKKSVKKTIVKKNGKKKKILNKKGKASTKTLIIILIIVIVVGLGAIFGIKALSNKKGLNGGGMDATIKIAQYRYYKYKNKCQCKFYTVGTSKAVNKSVSLTASTKYANKDCTTYCTKNLKKIYSSSREIYKVEGKISSASKTNYSSWTTSTKVPSGYTKSNKQTRYITKSVKEYSIKYNGNGATSGSTSSQKHTYGSSKTLTANGFVKTGYTFLGWATSADGAVKYANKASVKNLTSKDGATITLYAKWKVNVATINYHVNGGKISGGLSSIKSDSSLVYINNNKMVTKVNYDSKIISDGLNNPNNPAYLNIVKSGYKAQDKKEWCTNPNGSGTCYNDASSAYKGQDFCNLDKGNCTVTLYVNWQAIPKVKIHFISQTTSADAILLESDGHFAMVDTGVDITDPKSKENNPEKVIEYLKALKVKTLDFILITHAHEDHLGGGLDILNSGIKVKRVYIKTFLRNGEKSTGSADRYIDMYNNFMKAVKALSIPITYIETLKEGYTFNLDEMKISLYNTEQLMNKTDYAGKSENFNSVVQYIKIGNTKTLLGADSYSKEIFTKIVKKVGDIDVLKVPHHAYTICGVTPENAEIMNPKYLVVTNSTAKMQEYRETGVDSGKCLDNFNNDIPRYYVNHTSKSLIIDYSDNKIKIVENN